MSEAVANAALTPATGPKPGSETGALRGDRLTNFFLDGVPDDAGEAAPATNAQQAGLELPESEPDPSEIAEDGENGEPEAEVEAKPALPEGKGTRDKPYSVKDLPQDRFVEIKVNGKREIVPMSELADGHIRHETFTRVHNEAKDALAKANTVVERAQAQQRAFGEKINAFLDSPNDFYEFMSEHAPKTLEAMARKLAADMVEWQKNPQTKYERDNARTQRKLDQQRAELDARRDAEETERRTSTAANAAKAALAPGYQAGLKKIGVSDPTTLTAEFRATVRVLLERTQALGRALTAEDVTAAMVRAAQLEPPKATVAARKPEPAPARPAPARKPAASSQAKPGTRRDADWILRGTKYA